MFASKIESISPRGGAIALAASFALSTILTAAPAACAADPIPAPAAAAGYRIETLASDSFSTKNVDMNASYGHGFQWYFNNFFGVAAAPSGTSFNSDGSVNVATTLVGWGSGGSNIASAGSIGRAPYYVGTAYGGGGYFEATFAFDNTSVDTTKGWPAWWGYSLEQFTWMSGKSQWPGQPSGYDHFIETDFFEYDVSHGNNYGGNLHDWYGQNNSGNYQLPWTTVVRTVPSTTNFNQYHRYGFLWKPATATAKGALSYYFDGVQVGPTTYYTKWTNQPPAPGANTPWTFGVIDNRHVVLILGTSPPVAMKIKSVQVWQASAANNVHN